MTLTMRSGPSLSKNTTTDTTTNDGMGEGHLASLNGPSPMRAMFFPITSLPWLARPLRLSDNLLE